MLYQYLFPLQQLGPDRPELHRRGRDGAGAGGLSSQVAVTHAMAFRGAAFAASVALTGGHGSLLGQKSIPLYKFKIFWVKNSVFVFNSTKGKQLKIEHEIGYLEKRLE